MGQRPTPTEVQRLEGENRAQVQSHLINLNQRLFARTYRKINSLAHHVLRHLSGRRPRPRSSARMLLLPPTNLYSNE